MSVLLCTLLGLACAEPPREPIYPDAMIIVLCPYDKSDSGPLITDALKKTQDLWWTTTPQSDAAAFSIEGALIGVDLSPNVCYVKTPIQLPGDGHPVVLQHGNLIDNGAEYLIETTRDNP